MGIPLHVATEQSVAIPPVSEPQPDIILTSEPVGPGPIPVASVRPLVEVSDTTIRFDRTYKAAIYAEANIDEYWIVDITRRIIRQMHGPDKGAYRELKETALENDVASSRITGLTVSTSGL